MLLTALKEMHAYVYDPRLRMPVTELDFIAIKKGDNAIFLTHIPSQETAVARNGQWGKGLADLFIFLLGEKLIYQAWYESKREQDGDFFEAWGVVVP